MDEQQLRALVKEAIARHLGPPSAAPLSPPAPTLVPAAVAAAPIAVAQFHIARAPGEVECVIEPAVTCNHCGHCLCYGH
jgi:hypothetical protein